MAISVTADFKSTTIQIIEDAFFEINAFGVDEVISDGDYNKAKRSLNRMVKTWQGQGYHLWKKANCLAFFDTNFNTDHYIGGTSAVVPEQYLKLIDNNTAYTVNGNFSSGSSYITLNSVVGLATNDKIVVTLENGLFFIDYIQSIVINDVYFKDNSLPNDVIDGAVIYAYNSDYEITDAFDLLNVNRRIYQTAAPYTYQSIPLSYLDWQSFFQLPNKADAGNPNSYTFNKEIDFLRFKFWPVPASDMPIFELLLYRKIHDFDVNSNNADFPQEWEEAIVLNLALKLAPSFGKLQNASYGQLKNQANEALSDALAFDQESASLFLSLARY